MPRFTTHGFDVCPPDLPPAESPATLGYLSSAQSVATQVHYVLSLVSFNVGSPDGFCGKLSYLRHQMHGHSPNVVGIQESPGFPGF